MRVSGLLVVASVLVFIIATYGSASLAAPSEQVERAHALWQSREYAVGLALAKSVSAPTPDPRLIKVTGECYMGLKNWTQAIKCFEQILVCPESPFRVQDVKSWIMECHVENNEPARALRALDELVAQYPSDVPGFYYLLGRRFQWTRRYAEGAEQFQKALKMPKTDPLAKEVAMRYICCCLSALNWDAALAYLPTFLSDYPDAVPEIIGGELERWKFKTTPAIQIVQKAASEAHGENKLKVGLADSYAMIHEWDKATALLDSVTEDFRGKSAQWHAASAKCDWGRSQYSEGIAHLKEALKLGSTPQLRRLLMEYQRDAGQWDDMIATAQSLQTEWPDKTAEWRLNQGWAYLDMKQYDKAVPVFREVISRFPDQRWIIRGAQVSLAECLYRQDKGETALADLKAYYRDRSDLQCEYQLICAQVMYYGARSSAASITALDRFLADYPADPLAKDAKQFLVRVLQSAGRLDEAASVLEATSVDIPLWNTWDEIALLRRIAEIRFQAKDYKKAADTYSALAKTKSSSKEDRAAAMYRLAVCEHELGHLDSAVRLLHALLADFPSTSAAGGAKGSLTLWTQFGQEEGE